MRELNRLITIGTLSDRLGVGEQRLRRLCNRGKVPFGTIGGMRVFDTRDVPTIRAACVVAGLLQPDRAASAAEELAHAD